MLSRLVQSADREHLPLYALEWHVDYWDYLGWKDPFDSHRATERQYAYAHSLPSSMYTPQAVINGTIVPSYAGDFSEVDSITRSLMKGSTVTELTVRVRPAAAGGVSWQVHAKTARAPAGAVLLIALAEGGLGATPTAGENAGRTLLHANVVRSVRQISAAGGEVVIDAPAGIDPARSRIIGLVQDPGTLRIYAAAQAFLTSPAAGALLPAGTLPSPSGAKITGRVVDSHGRGVSSVPVQACSGTLCIPGVTRRRGLLLDHGGRSREI